MDGYKESQSEDGYVYITSYHYANYKEPAKHLYKEPVYSIQGYTEIEE